MAIDVPMDTGLMKEEAESGIESDDEINESALLSHERQKRKRQRQRKSEKNNVEIKKIRDSGSVQQQQIDH